MPRLRPHTFLLGTFAALSIANGAFAQDGAQAATDLVRPRDPSWVEPEPTAYPACAVAPAPEATVAAKGAFEAGNAAFNEADYARSLLYWEDAFRRDCTASAMLKNLGHAYALDNQFKHALLALETYLERGATAAERPGLEERLAELKVQVAQEKRRLKDSSRDNQAKSTGRNHGETAKSPSNLTSVPTTETQPEANQSETGFRSPIPLALAGAGAVALGLGAVKWIGAKQDETSLAKSCPSHKDCNPSVAEQGNKVVDREILWSIVGGAGAALLAGGIVWYLVQSPEPAANTQTSARRTHTALSNLRPELGFRYAGLSWSHAL